MQAARHMAQQGVAAAAADPASLSSDGRGRRAPSVAFGRGDEDEEAATTEGAGPDMADDSAQGEASGALGLAQRLYERQKIPLGMDEDDVELLER